jgi:quinol monooxygenase YgiN
MPDNRAALALGGRARGLQFGEASMLLATISFRVQPHKRSEALSALDSLVQRMRMIAGCSRSRVLTDSEDPNIFMLASEWNDASAAEAFLNSREFQIFKGVRILMRDEPFIVLDDVRTRVTRLMRAS